MGDSHAEVLYIAPSAASRTGVADYGKAFLAALDTHPGISTANLLDAHVPERLQQLEGGVEAVRLGVEWALDEREFVRDQVLHAEMGQLTQREFWAAQRAARLRPQTPLCLTFHDPLELPPRVQPPKLDHKSSRIEQLVSFLSHRISEPMVKRVEEAFLKRASVFLCLSRHAGEILVRHFPEHAHKVAWIPPIAIGPEPPEDLEPNARAPEERIHITLFGFLRPEKGIEEFLQALASMHKNESLWKRARVRIRGRLSQKLVQSNFEGRVRKLIDDLGLKHFVRFNPGAMPEWKVAQLLRETDILVLPQRPGSCQGTCLSLLCAMRWAVAVVASDADSLPELLENERDALLYPSGQVDMLAECIERLLAEADTRVRLARALRQKALERHSPQVVAPILSDIYSRMLEARDAGLPVRLPKEARLIEPDESFFTLHGATPDHEAFDSVGERDAESDTPRGAPARG